jgi:hypothetical protein
MIGFSVDYSRFSLTNPRSFRDCVDRGADSMAERNALTAKLSGSILEITSLSDPDILGDTTFSLFGDNGGRIAARLPAIVDRRGEFDFVAVPTEAASRPGLAVCR